MGTLIPLRRQSPITITHCFFLCAVVVMQQGAGLAALLSSDGLPVTVSFSFSVCRTCRSSSAEQFCRGTSHFGAGFFLLLVFLMKICRFSPLLSSSSLLPSAAAMLASCVSPLAHTDQLPDQGQMTADAHQYDEQ